MTCLHAVFLCVCVHLAVVHFCSGLYQPAVISGSQRQSRKPPCSAEPLIETSPSSRCHLHTGDKHSEERARVAADKQVIACRFRCELGREGAPTRPLCSIHRVQVQLGMSAALSYGGEGFGLCPRCLAFLAELYRSNDSHELIVNIIFNIGTTVFKMIIDLIH